MNHLSPLWMAQVSAFFKACPPEDLYLVWTQCSKCRFQTPFRPCHSRAAATVLGGFILTRHTLTSLCTRPCPDCWGQKVHMKKPGSEQIPSPRVGKTAALWTHSPPPGHWRNSENTSSLQKPLQGVLHSNLPRTPR